MASVLPTVAMTALQYSVDSAQQKAAKAAQKSETAASIQQVRYLQQVEDQARRDRLRRAIAAQRARFGAQGLSASGTANAVLGGLAAETDKAIAADNSVTALRVNKLLDESSRRRSLLEASNPQNQMTFSLFQKGIRTIPLIDI
jgi:hypothetical protein